MVTMLSLGFGGRRGERHSMEILACIPELPSAVGPAAQGAASELPRPTVVVVVPASSPEPAATADRAEMDDAESVSPAPRRGSTRQSQPSQLFSPSIVALVAVAAVVWAAAWQNDRLRLEAARQQRPERLAQELPATAGATRSLTP